MVNSRINGLGPHRSIEHDPLFQSHEIWLGNVFHVIQIYVFGSQPVLKTIFHESAFSQSNVVEPIWPF